MRGNEKDVAPVGFMEGNEAVARGAMVGSEFLNQAEAPIGIYKIAKAAGATYVSRYSGMDPQLPEELKRAIRHKVFSVVENIGLCTGRYTKRNKLTPKAIDEILASAPPEGCLVPENQRPERLSAMQALPPDSMPPLKMIIILRCFADSPYLKIYSTLRLLAIPAGITGRGLALGEEGVARRKKIFAIGSPRLIDLPDFAYQTHNNK